MSRYLFAISLGPVQEFIAAGRRLRDLAAGSRLLCELAQAAADWLQEQNATLVFPDAGSLTSQDDMPKTANKLVALLDTDEPSKQIRHLRQYLNESLKQRRQEMVDNARLDGLVDLHVLNDQTSHFLEFYAAWVECPDDGRYAAARKRADQLLAARKATREFVQPQSRPVPKSSLDGGRDAVLIYHDKADGPTKTACRKIGLRPHEQLDGVSLLKRWIGKENDRFISMARIAADPFIRALSPEQLSRFGEVMEQAGSASRCSLPQYQTFPWDTAWFFEPTAEDGDDASAAAAKEMYELAHRRDLKVKPHPYVAMLVADGDGMGACIDAQTDRASHQRLSQALAQFAAEAERIVTDHHGLAIYCGGDDVLAVLPVDTSLQCADCLRWAFAQQIQRADVTGNAPTLSVGVSISHYSDHLQVQLDRARTAERAAKHGNKNQLAVTVQKRSGGTGPIVVHSWADDPVNTVWAAWLAMYDANAVAHGTPYKLRELSRELIDRDGGQRTVIDARVAVEEVRRVLSHGRESGGDQPVDPRIVAQIIDRLDPDCLSDSLTQLVDEMLIAFELCNAGDGGGD